MADLLFDALNGVSLDNHTVQSILDSTTLPTAGPPTTITLDEEDVFLCGKCKKQFTSFSLFMCHKKEHNADNGQESECIESASFQQLEVQALDSSLNTSDLCEPIILSDADILSFSIDDEDVLNIATDAQTNSSMPNTQDGSSFLATNTDSSNSLKQLVEAISVTNNFDVTSLSGEPVVLTPEPLQNSFTSSLPIVQSVTSDKYSSSTTVSCGKNVDQNINILASCPERQPKNCKVLLPNIDYIQEDIENGTILLECDDTTDKLLQYGNGSVNSDGTVLLDYCDADAITCEVLLSNGESIGYIDSTNQICEYSSFSGTSENVPAGRQEAVSVNLLDVIASSNCSSAAVEFSKAVNEAVNTQENSQERSFSISIQELSSGAVTDVTELIPEIINYWNFENECSTSDKPSNGKVGGRVASMKGPKFKCRYCDKMFTKNFDLGQHLRSHTGEKPFQCVVCGRAFSQKSNLKKHMSTHKVWPDGISRTLPKEPLLFLEKYSIDDNKKNGSSDDPVNDESDSIIIVDRSYVCQYCNTSFSTYSELKTHMKKHAHQKVYKCIQHNCDKTFVDLDSFVNHTASHTDEVQYCCHVCLKKFNSLTDLSIHQHTHDHGNKTPVKNPRYFPCTKCASKFTSAKALELHTSTTNHYFPCTHCGKIFACERFLRRHLTIHGTPETFVCPTCGKGFRTEQYLNIHRLIHSGVKPYKCMHCPAAFNRKDKLSRHNLIHQTVKKYKCPFRNYLGCSKEFNRQDKLKLHILTHSYVKPFRCQKCNKVFRKQNQRNHDLNYHSADAPFSCTHCGLKFNKKTHLSTHVCDKNDISKGQQNIKETRSTGSRRKTAPKVAQSRKFKKTRSKKRQSSSLKNNYLDKRKESYQVMLPQVKNSVAGEENETYPDSVPTIEIILVSARHEKEGENGVYHVVFPTSSSGEVQTKVDQKHRNDVLNNSSKGVLDGHNGQAVIAGVNVVNENSGM